MGGSPVIDPAGWVGMFSQMARLRGRANEEEFPTCGTINAAEWQLQQWRADRMEAPRNTAGYPEAIRFGWDDGTYATVWYDGTVDWIEIVNWPPRNRYAGPYPW